MAFLGALSMVSIFVAIVWLIVAMIKHANRKSPVTLLLVSVGLFVISIIATVSSADKTAAGSTTVNVETTQEKEVEEIVIDREKCMEDFQNIRAAFKNNELAAIDEYRGKTYTLIGKVESVSEGLFSPILGEINVTVVIKDGDTICYVYADFDESYKEVLKTYSKGDEIIFTGECYTWGNWDNCKPIKG